MFRKVCISIATIFAAMHLLSACCNCPDDAEYNRRVAFVGTQLSTGRYTIDSTEIRSYQYAGNDFRDTLLALRLQIDGQLLAKRSSTSHDWTGTSALACKCDEIYYQPAVPVTGLKITTLFDFDVTHPAGTPVTSYFKTPGYQDGIPALTDIGIPDLKNLYVTSPVLSMMLDARPAMAGPQQFAVELQLVNGDSFRDTTAVLEF